MDETVWVYRETVTLVRVAPPRGGGPRGAALPVGARLGRVGAGLLVAALGLAGTRLAARALTAGARPAALPAGGGTRALGPGSATGDGALGPPA